MAYSENLKQILSYEPRDRNMILDRMRIDCEYYLGLGDAEAKYLWGGSVKEHMEFMKAIYDSFAEDEKPEWLTTEQISSYESKMNSKRIFNLYRWRITTNARSEEHLKDPVRFNVIEYLCYFPKIDPYEMAASIIRLGYTILFDDTSISAKENQKKEKLVNKALKTSGGIKL